MEKISGRVDSPSQRAREKILKHICEYRRRRHSLSLPSSTYKNPFVSETTYKAEKESDAYSPSRASKSDKITEKTEDDEYLKFLTYALGEVREMRRDLISMHNMMVKLTSSHQ